MVFLANSKQKKVKEAILISNKAYFKIKTVIRDKEGHNIKINETIQREDITTVCVCVCVCVCISNIKASHCMRQIQPVIKGETDSSTVIVRDVNTPTWKSAIRKKS